MNLCLFLITSSHFAFYPLWKKFRNICYQATFLNRLNKVKKGKTTSKGSKLFIVWGVIWEILLYSGTLITCQIFMVTCWFGILDGLNFSMFWNNLIYSIIEYSTLCHSVFPTNVWSRMLFNFVLIKTDSDYNLFIVACLCVFFCKIF